MLATRLSESPWSIQVEYQQGAMLFCCSKVVPQLSQWDNLHLLQKNIDIDMPHLSISNAVNNTVSIDIFLPRLYT